ncbi:neuroligin- x-linked-like protein [Lasius niger]|uniref:Neuroligin-x-linked-like protein n=1 Tax=Lasius niger TaxID=67767 RepID=A0A0J7L2Y4_LASNI|nr:neuroligin- x-linked-like protein [Lasius niger]
MHLRMEVRARSEHISSSSSSVITAPSRYFEYETANGEREPHGGRETGGGGKQWEWTDSGDGIRVLTALIPGKPGTRQKTNRLPGERCWKQGDKSDGSNDERRDKRRRRRSAEDIASKEISQDGASYDGTVAKSVLLLALLCAQCCLAATEALAGTQKYCTRTVKTRYGILRGIEARSSTAVETYYGVPYATPPLGALRYMPPVTPTPWRGTKIADTMPPACPQHPPPPDEELPWQRRAYLKRLGPVLANQSEDCLYLNLYVPKPPHGKSPMYYSSKDNNNNLEFILVSPVK